MSRSYKDGRNQGAHRFSIPSHVHRGVNRSFRAKCHQALREGVYPPPVKILKRLMSKNS